ncbi:MAG: tripartite tricarboxylate transporter substrate binding protein [Betaproteobacteria bacterium]|nr:MAG: tripartite tricarboxylate transporter substrate binding protein [Betaproteobacteria bacterium]
MSCVTAKHRWRLTQGNKVKQSILPALASFGIALSSALTATEYPDKPVRVLVPTLAGSTPDVVARAVAPGLGVRLGNRFIIDNRGGANGLIGTELAARATPDGHTLLLGTTATLTVMRHLHKEVPFDALKDFVPIGLVSVRPYLVVVNPSLPARTLGELLALAKARRGGLIYASAGRGSATHLAMEFFASVTGIKLRHVPYKNSPQAVAAIVGSRVEASMLSIRDAYGHVLAQRLRALATTSSRRSPQLPQVPTAAESGLNGFEAITWFALLAPAGTPRSIVERLNTALGEVVVTPEVRARFVREGVEPADADAAVLRRLIKRDIEFYGNLTRLSGVKVN